MVVPDAAAMARATDLDLTDFRPTRTQEAFLDCLERYALFSGGYGAGKTRTGAEAALMLALLNPGCAGLVVSPTWQMLARTTEKALRQAIPRELIRHDRVSDRAIDLFNGSTVYFGSAEKPGSLEGTNLAWAWLDEARLMKHESFRVVSGRVRDRTARRLQVIVTTTPTMGWLYEQFGKGRPNHCLFVGSTRENAHNLSPGFVEDLEATYPKRIARALIDGEFVLATGSVFPDFDKVIHAIDWPTVPHVDTVLGIDFGIRSPSVIVAQVPSVDVPLADGRTIPAGSIVIVDEVHPDQTPTARLVPVIQQLRDYRPGMVAHVDPAGGQRSQAEGRDSIAILRDDAQLEVRTSTAPEERHVPNGIALIQQALSPMHGPPALYVTREVMERTQRRGVVEALIRSEYPERDGVQIDDAPRKDGVVEHARDALRYLVVGVMRDRRHLRSQMLQRSYRGWAA